MNIIAQQHNQSVICKMPDGKIIEITMVSVHGEDVTEEMDLHEAVRLLRQSLHFVDPKPEPIKPGLLER